MTRKRLARDLSMLYHGLKGSRLAKMDEPYLARCNQCNPAQTKAFATEKLREKWVSEHRLSMKLLELGKPQHDPRLALKVPRYNDGE